VTSGLRAAGGTCAARAVLVMAAVLALFVSCVARAADHACRAPTSPSAIPEVLEFTEGHGYFGSDRVYLERGRVAARQRTVRTRSTNGRYASSTRPGASTCG
jgi:hypothetical protein